MIVLASLMMGMLVLFHLYVSYMIVQQNMVAIGIATEYIEVDKWNAFINAMISSGNATSYEMGYDALQQAGYQNSASMFFLQPYVWGGVVFTVVILLLIIILLILRLRKKEKRMQELECVTDWIHSESTRLSEQEMPQYIPLELIQAVKEQKEKSVQLHMIQEENTESMMKYMENISHQLKTPLAVVRATCERVSMQHPEVEDKMLTCLSQTDKMTVLIRDFLQLGRFDCKKQKMKFEYILAGDLIEIVANELDTVAQKRNLTFIINGEKDIRWHCDVFWMEEILGNVLKNCVEHSEHGDININYACSNGMNQVTIRDCGAGLKEGTETKIFERYSTVNRINIEGSGLGLSIAHEAIKLHFGTITARNHRQGGIEFRISFPQLDSDNIYR